MNQNKTELAQVQNVSVNVAQLPVIELKTDLHRMYDESQIALAATGRVYHRGGVLVGLTDDGKTFPFCPATMMILLSRAAKWVKKVKNEEGETSIRPVAPPREVAAALPKEHGWPKIPELLQVVDHPLFMMDGRLLKPKYSAETKFYGNFRPLESVNLDATRSDALAAAKYISTIFETLDLDTDSDKAAALCAALTAVSRPALATAPLFLITAPVAGSGKGLLARLIAGFAAEGEPPAKTLQADDDEIKKELISALLTGAPVLFFDEVCGGEIDSVPLRTLATSQSFSGRLLGQNKEVNLSTRSLVLITGNNVTPSADTARRMVEIRLDPKCESPATRKFKTNPFEFMREHRYSLLRAVLTIQASYRNHIKSGGAEPEATGVGSFADWNTWCRLPVLWLTGHDPAKRLLDQIKSDPAKAELAAVLTEWQREFGSDQMTAGRVSKSPKVYEAIKSMAGARNRDMSTTEIGRWIARHKDRIVEGKKIEKSASLSFPTRMRPNLAALLCISICFFMSL